jgi:hypothetical protein
MNIAEAIAAYLECALWSSLDWPEDQNEEPGPLDDKYSVSDLSDAALAAMTYNVLEFIAANAEDIVEAGIDAGQVGHDFWLTRNGHGTGFWDRGLGAVGDRLSAAAKVYGECDIYPVGDRLEIS